MKLTADEIMGDAAKAGKKKNEILKKGNMKKEKPEKKKWGKKADPEPEEELELSDGDLASEDEAEYEDGEVEDAEAEDAEEEDVPVSGIKPKLKIAALVVVIAAGFAISVISIRGFLNSMRMEQEISEGMDDYDPAYTDALNADPENFDAVNAQRTGTEAPVEAPVEEVSAEAPPEEAPADPAAEAGTSEQPAGDGIQVEGTDHVTSDAEKVQILEAEVARLTQEASDAKSSSATMEQELNNAKALLDASTAREAALQAELDALKAEQK